MPPVHRVARAASTAGQIHGRRNQILERWREADHRVAAPYSVLGEEVVHPSARLFDQQEAGKRIPGVHVQLAIRLAPAARRVGEPESARAGAHHLGASLIVLRPLEGAGTGVRRVPECLPRDLAGGARRCANCGETLVEFGCAHCYRSWTGPPVFAASVAASASSCARSPSSPLGASGVPSSTPVMNASSSSRYASA